jgi:hypothetical protein
MALKDVIIATQADLRDNPEHANATFTADSRQVDGLRSETKIRQFSLTIDEPPNLGGPTAVPIRSSLCSRRSPPAKKSPTAPMRPRSVFRSRAFR